MIKTEKTLHGHLAGIVHGTCGVCGPTEVDCEMRRNSNDVMLSYGHVRAHGDETVDL